MAVCEKEARGDAEAETHSVGEGDAEGQKLALALFDTVRESDGEPLLEAEARSEAEAEGE